MYTARFDKLVLRSVWIQGRMSVGHRCPLTCLKAWAQRKTVHKFLNYQL